MSPQEATGSPTVLFFVGIISDVELLAPLIAALDRQKRLPVRARVVVSHKALRKTPELASLLGAKGIVFEEVDDEKLVAGRAPSLAGVRAVVAATESTAPAHLHAHALARRANRLGLRTYTMQHGYENIGLTWFDREFEPHGVHFESREILVWGPLQRLHREVLPETRERCIPLGCSKAAALPSQLPRKPRPGPLIAVFENLHWSRYPPAYVDAFLADLGDAARSNPACTFLVKPHPAGKWFTQRCERPRPEAENLVVVVPGSEPWKEYDATATIALADAVITTPSTVALDASRFARPVAVIANGLDVAAYDPLFRIEHGSDWRTFLRALGDDAARSRLVQSSRDFVAAALVAGDGATRIVDHVVREIALDLGVSATTAPTVLTRLVTNGHCRVGRLTRLRHWLLRAAPPSRVGLPTASYLYDARPFALSHGAEEAISRALAVRSGIAPSALVWDDAVLELHWRVQRLRLLGVRRATRNRELMRRTDLRGAGAVREDVLDRLVADGVIASAEETDAALRHLLEHDSAGVLPVEGVWRFLGLAAERNAVRELKSVAEPLPRARSIGVIVNYRDQPDRTIACIESVAAQQTSATIELLLVNNQSGPLEHARVVAAATRLRAERERFDFRLLDHDHPYNHSVQNNRAAALLATDVIVFLNNDARLLSRDLLQRLADRALLAGVATAGPRVVGKGGQLVCAGMTVSATDDQWSENADLFVRELEGPAYSDVDRETVGNSFACAAIARERWIEGGGLDGVAYPSQYNDADLCLRLRARGLRHLYVADVAAFHEPGVSEARNAAALRDCRDSLRLRHRLVDHDRVAPDHYKLREMRRLGGADGELWSDFLSLHRRVASWSRRRGQIPVPLPHERAARAALARLQALAAEQTSVLPIGARSRDDQLEMEREGMRRIVELSRAWFQIDLASARRFTPTLEAIAARYACARAAGLGA